MLVLLEQNLDWREPYFKKKKLRNLYFNGLEISIFFVPCKTWVGAFDRFEFMCKLSEGYINHLNDYLVEIIGLGFSIYSIAIIGIFFNNRNLIFLLIYLDLLLLGVSLNFIIFSLYWSDPKGLVMALLVLAYAAAESALGLAVFVSYYSYTKSLDVMEKGFLHG